MKNVVLFLLNILLCNLALANDGIQERIWQLEASQNNQAAEREKDRLRDILSAHHPVLTSKEGESILKKALDTFKLEDALMALMKTHYGSIPESPVEGALAIEAIAKGIDASLLPAFQIVMESNRMQLRPEMQLVQFAEGVFGVFKPKGYSQHKKEVAAYKIDQIYGFSFIPMTLERTIDGEVGSIQYFIQKSKPLTEIQEKVSDADFAFFKGLRFFDYLTTHGDRSPRRRNFVISPEGRLVAIDNDAIFCQLGAETQSFNEEIESNPAKHAPDPVVLSRLKTVTDDVVIKTLKNDLSGKDIGRLLKQRTQFLERLK